MYVTLGCCHLLGVAAMNVVVQIALCVLLLILCGMYPEVSIGFCGIVDSFLWWESLLILHRHMTLGGLDSLLLLFFICRMVCGDVTGNA